MCVCVCPSGKRNKLRVYYLSWLRNKILHNDPEVEKKQGWTTVGDMEGCGHYRVVKYERIKFLVIALKNSVEVYAWAPKPYHKFMAFKVIPESSLLLLPPPPPSTVPRSGSCTCVHLSPSLLRSPSLTSLTAPCWSTSQ